MPDFDDLSDIPSVPLSELAAPKLRAPKRLARTSGRPDLDSLYEEKGTAYGVDPNLLLEQGRQESINFKPSVIAGRLDSPVGAKGVAQFMAPTAREFGLRIGNGIDERTDPAKSIDAQARMMRRLLDKYNGDERAALAAYNSGHNRSYQSALRAAERIPETRGYVSTILKKRGSASPLAPPVPKVDDLSDVPSLSIADIPTIRESDVPVLDTLKPPASKALPLSASPELPQVIEAQTPQVAVTPPVPRLKRPTAPLPAATSRIIEDDELTPVPFTQAQPTSGLAPRLAAEAARKANFAPDNIPQGLEQGQAIPLSVPANLNDADFANAVNDATLRQLGGERLVELGRQYRAETGRNIAQLGQPFPELVESGQAKRTGDAWSVQVAPQRSLVEILNAYGQGGLEAAQRVASGASQDVAEYNKGYDAAQRPGLSGTARRGAASVITDLAQFGQNAAQGARALGTAATSGFDSPEYESLIEEDRKQQEVLNAARAAIPEERSAGAKFARGVGELGAKLPMYALAGQAAPLVAGLEQANEGVMPATATAAQFIAPMGAGRLAKGLLRSPAAGLARRAAENVAERTAQGAINVGQGAVTPEGRTLEGAASNFGIGAIMPVGKAQGADSPALRRRPTLGEQADALVDQSPASTLSSPRVVKTIVRHSNPEIDGDAVVGKTTGGKLIVEGADGIRHTIKHPRKGGNREAAIVKQEAGGVPEPQTVKALSAGAEPSAPKVGETIEYEEGFPPRTIRGVVTRLQRDPVTGYDVPIVRTTSGREYPAAEWYDTGRVIGKTETPLSPTIEPAAPKRAERSFPKSAETAGQAKGSDLAYDVLTNKESVERAAKVIESKGVDRAVADLAQKTEIGAEETATGLLLMQKLQKAGDHERAADVASGLSRKLTEAGQAVQAASIVSRLSPEGIILAAQRQLRPNQKLTGEQSASLVEGATKVKEAEARVSSLEQQIDAMRAKLKDADTGRRPRALRPKLETLQARLDVQAEAALARVKAKLNPNTLHDVTDFASVIPDIAVWGAARLAQKGVTVANFSADVVATFGEAAKPHLREIYRQSYALFDSERKAVLQASRERAVLRENPQAVKADLQRLVNDRLEAQKRAQKARRELARQFNELSRTPAQRVLRTGTDLRRANLLTAAKTHLTNMTSNAMFQATEELSRPLAAVGDMIAKRKTGFRTTRGLDVPAVFRSAFKTASAKDEDGGIRRAKEIILGREVLPLEGYGKERESTESKMQLGSSDTGIKILDTYINTVFRTLEAEDALFKVYAFGRELSDIAKSQAISEGAKNKSINVRERAKELRANPTDAMLAEASAYADYATFQNDNRVSTVIRAGKGMLGAAGRFAIETVAPFDRTPTNIIYRALENSPLGLLSAANKYRKIGSRAAAEKIADEAFTREEQKEFARTFGRASTGTILAALALVLAHKGLLSGSSDYHDDKEDYFKKRQEFGGGGMLHIPFTNQRVSIINTPAGKAMATVAAIYEQWDKDDATTDEKVTGSAKTVSRVALDQPLVRAARESLSGKSLSESTGSYAGSMVPASSLLSSIGEVTDAEARKTFGQGFGAQLKRPIPSPLPLGRKTLPVNEGVNREERGGIGRRLLRSFDPFNTTTEGMGSRSSKKKGGSKSVLTPPPVPKLKPPLTRL